MITCIHIISTTIIFADIATDIASINVVDDIYIDDINGVTCIGW